MPTSVSDSDDWDDDASEHPVPGDLGAELDVLFDLPSGNDSAIDDGISALIPDDAAAAADVQIPVVRITNPPGTIGVTAHMNGAVAQVDLEPGVTRLTEDQLEQEILFVADVAGKRATAVVHVFVVEMMVEQGLDLAVAREFAEEHLPFATPAQAEDALATLTARYAEQSDGSPG